MMLGADYSWARPGGAALRSAGVVAVGRYLAADGRGITAAEYADLKAHGVGVWLVREGRASGMLGGHDQGVADARASVNLITNAGIPAGSFVYAAADWDVTDAQFAACDDYLRGFASVLGLSRTGIYGGMHYLNHAHSAGLAVAFWQAGATSWNHRETPQMRIDFKQTTITPPLPGTDHNYIYSTATLVGAQPMEVLMAFKDTLEIFQSERGYFIAGPGFVYDVGDKDGVTGAQKLAALAKIGVPTTQVDTGTYDILRIILRGNDLTQGLAQPLAAVHAAVTQPISRDGAEISQAADNAATGTLVRHFAAAGVPVDSAAVANAIIQQMPSSTLTPEQLTQAVTTGLATLTLKATS